MYKERDIISYIIKLTKNKIIEVPISPSWEFNKNKYFELMPTDFLNYAKIDLRNGTKKSIINTLSNIKRALHCQTDCILKSFGLYKSRMNFPEKLKTMAKIGIVDANILSKINKNRNLLEHEYVIPNKDQVEDFFSATSLFTSATTKFIQKRVIFIEIHRTRGFHDVRLEYSPKDRKMKISFSIYSKWKKRKEGGKSAIVTTHSFFINDEDNDFYRILRKYNEIIDLMI